MHEMSLAMSIVDLAVAKAAGEGAERVTEVEILVGPLAGVMAEALQFCFAAAARETVAAAAELVVVESLASAHCRDCGRRFSTGSYLPACQSCGSEQVTVSGGDELKIISVTVE